MKLTIEINIDKETNETKDSQKLDSVTKRNIEVNDERIMNLVFNDLTLFSFVNDFQ